MQSIKQSWVGGKGVGINGWRVHAWCGGVGVMHYCEIANNEAIRVGDKDNERNK